MLIPKLSGPRYSSRTVMIVRPSCAIWVRVPYENVLVDINPDQYIEDVEYDLRLVTIENVTFWHRTGKQAYSNPARRDYPEYLYGAVHITKRNATPAQMSWISSAEAYLRSGDDWLRAALEED